MQEQRRKLVHYLGSLKCFSIKDASSSSDKARHREWRSEKGEINLPSVNFFITLKAHLLQFTFAVRAIVNDFGLLTFINTWLFKRNVGTWKRIRQTNHMRVKKFQPIVALQCCLR